jgi:predicted Zn-dependent protease with MMP-like domain
MSSQDEEVFDRILEEVLDELPPRLHDLLEEVPLVVEDRPSPRVMREMGIRDRRDLCGLFTGVPLTERHVDDTTRMPDVITIFREGIWDAAMNRRRRRVTDQSLKRQIRITVLHEIGHHFGLREADLRDLGYQ